METWQFSLFFAALLVGYLLLHLRVARFEEHLRALKHLGSIDQRLEGLVAGLPDLDKERVERIEALLQRLHDDLEDLKEAATSVGESVVKLPQRSAAAQGLTAAGMSADGAVFSAGPPASVSGRIRAIVESRLLQLGYTRLKLLTDLSEASPDKDVEVQVECERGHMPAKGRVLVRNGAVYDVAMQTVATTFP